MISIFWLVRLLAKVTSPSITVVPPVPPIAEVKLPPFNLTVPLFVRVVPMLSAVVVNDLAVLTTVA